MVPSAGVLVVAMALAAAVIISVVPMAAVVVAVIPMAAVVVSMVMVAVMAVVFAHRGGFFAATTAFFLVPAAVTRARGFAVARGFALFRQGEGHELSGFGLRRGRRGGRRGGRRLMVGV
jgi:hypothetical protein